MLTTKGHYYQLSNLSTLTCNIYNGNDGSVIVPNDKEDESRFIIDIRIGAVVDFKTHFLTSFVFNSSKNNNLYYHCCDRLFYFDENDFIAPYISVERHFSLNST